MNIKITVIIPTYNRANSYLLRAINSVLSQSYKPLEILICDDGSTDNTKAVIDSLDSNLVKYLYCGRNKRPSVPRNIGIKKAKGNWIAFLDSDDYWYENKLEVQVKILKKESTINAICSNAHVGKNNLYFSFPILKISQIDLTNSNYIINSSVLVKKKTLEEAKLYPENILFKAIEDYLLWFKICLNTKFYNINAPLLYYHTQSQDKISPKNSLNIFFKDLLIYFYFIYYSIKKINIKIIYAILKSAFKRLINYVKKKIGIIVKIFYKKKIKKNSKNKISVILPVYNSDEYIYESVKSILDQDHQNIELIIVDDCSTDRTSEIIECFFLKNKRIKYFKNKSRMGVSTSLNFALKQCSGDYIARMDADDKCINTRFSYQIKLFKSLKSVDILSNGVKYFGKKNKINYNRFSLTNSQILSRIFFYNPINHPTIFFHKKIKNKLIYDSNINGFEDWVLWINLITNGIKFYCDNKVVINYRLHKFNNSKNINNRIMLTKINLLALNFLNKKNASKFNNIKFFKIYSANYIDLFKAKLPTKELDNIKFYNFLVQNKLRSFNKFTYILKNLKFLIYILANRYILKNNIY